MAQAWDTECNAMWKLGVLEECNEPYGKPVAGSTLVCKIKRLWNGAIDKYRVRWVLQGFLQTYSVNFFHTSSPVQLVACIMTVTNCVALQCDVSSKLFWRNKIGIEDYSGEAHAGSERASERARQPRSGEAHAGSEEQVCEPDNQNLKEHTCWLNGWRAMSRPSTEEYQQGVPQIGTIVGECLALPIVRQVP